MNLQLQTKELGAIELEPQNIMSINRGTMVFYVDGFDGPLSCTRKDELETLIKQAPGLQVGPLSINPKYIVGVDHGTKAVCLESGKFHLHKNEEVTAVEHALIDNHPPGKIAILGIPPVTVRLDQIAVLRPNNSIVFKNSGASLQLSAEAAAEFRELPYWKQDPETWVQLTTEKPTFYLPEAEDLPDDGPEKADDIIYEDDENKTLIVSNVAKEEAEFRIEHFAKVADEIGIPGLHLEKDGPHGYRIVYRNFTVGRLSHDPTNHEIHLAIADAFATKDKQGIKADAYYKTVGFLQFGHVITDDDLRLIKKDAVEEQKRQILNPEFRPKTLKEMRTGQKPKPMSLHNLILQGIKRSTKSREKLKPLNFEALNRLLNEIIQAPPEEKARLIASAAATIRYNPTTEKVELAPWIKNEARRIQHPQLGNAYQYPQRDAAHEALVAVRFLEARPISIDRDRERPGVTRA